LPFPVLFGSECPNITPVVPLFKGFAAKMLEKIGINAMIDCVVTDNHEDAHGLGAAVPLGQTPPRLHSGGFFA